MPNASRLDPRLREIVREMGKRAARMDFEAYREKVGQTKKQNKFEESQT